ncbi:MAG: DUF4157 domain-containing protein [Cytophagia bacterium]|nr:DUF4157 domain-containing protein [Cytophagia bacterium]
MQEGSKTHKSYSEIMNRQAVALREGKDGASLEPPVQRKPNRTGLPDHLKSGIENLSGHSMDDVKVYYNSSKPAQLQAYAYAQGTNIHVAPGQEKHLPHEAWHVVQQRQGRVKPTMQLKSQVNINDDAMLEKEADVMGAKAGASSGIKNLYQFKLIPKGNFNSSPIAQLRVDVNPEDSSNDGSQFLIKYLGSGSNGSAYETSKNNVAKVGNIKPTTKKMSVNSDGIGFAPEFFEHQKPKGLNPSKEAGIEKEYKVMEDIYNHSPKPFIARPFFLGKISIKADEEPKEFDNDVIDGQQAIIMEKVNVLNITKPEKTIESKDLRVDHFNSIMKEIKIFTDLMELRWKFVAQGYLHKDIKHNNAGNDNESHLKAIDLGMVEKIQPDYHNKNREYFKDKSLSLYAQGTVPSDVVRSYAIMLSNILAHFGISKKGQNLVPEELYDVLKGLILREDSDSFGDMSKYIKTKLEPETIEYVKGVVKKELDPKIWRKPQVKSASERLKEQNKDEKTLP